jgi:transcriptional regulator with XRE-family HTH domain
LDLAGKLNVSQRHVSYVELGKCGASRALLIAWAGATVAPHGLRSAILQAAGYSDICHDGASSAGVTRLPRAVALLLRSAHFPAIIAFNRRWRVLGMNASARFVCSSTMPGYWHSIGADPARMDLFDALLDSRGLMQNMINAPRMAHELLRQLQQEAWSCDELTARVSELAVTFGQRYAMSQAAARTVEQTMARLEFRTPSGPLSFHSLRCAHVDDPATSENSIHIQHWIPANSQTANVLAQAAKESIAGVDPKPSI